MTTYPDWMYKALAHARKNGQWHEYQNDAAAGCFDAFALDKWDEALHQQSSRRVLSIRDITGIHKDQFSIEPSSRPKNVCNVREWFEEGKGQLPKAFYLSDNENVRCKMMKMMILRRSLINPSTTATDYHPGGLSDDFNPKRIFNTGDIDLGDECNNDED